MTTLICLSQSKLSMLSGLIGTTLTTLKLSIGDNSMTTQMTVFRFVCIDQSYKGGVHIMGVNCPRSDPDIAHRGYYLTPGLLATDIHIQILIFLTINL